ncbi:right-handed parallel beta-helix repeat-containing protein [Aureibacillus halotolerans]|uniref:Nitrous oxidase accessory protein n=1 Tax=Aureibacillus halotolerans TaxID=1508390 RepID=A0A4R6TQ32_9BACI|nr:NosD domain-containing protein [Aureibacillus halotolerans]TDQ34617.1 nitrous oxidase accessory protein [Aureibacillus halotolerans]
MVLILSIVCANSVANAQQHTSIQQLIDQAEAGDTIHIPAGYYTGAMIIDKPLQIIFSKGSVLTHEGSESAVKITSDHVKLSGLKIVDRELKDAATVFVTGDSVHLEALHIQTGSYGIRLEKTQNGLLDENRIEWLPDTEHPVSLSDKKNGIDLYGAYNNRITNNHIRGVLDGIYLERSKKNVVSQNVVERARYGIHAMYTEQTIIQKNTSRLNFTGIIVMVTRGLTITENRVVMQNENVNSQGFLLYETNGATVQRNWIEGNRVGMNIQQSLDNQVMHNTFVNNYVGLQLMDAENNLITENSFIGNITGARSVTSVDNSLSGNYWDAFKGVDSDGDGKSNLPYAMNPLSLALFQSQPAFQLFYQSPGLELLERLYQADSRTWSMDKEPLMAPPDNVFSGDSSHVLVKDRVNLIAFLLLSFGCSIFYFGRRKLL